MSIVTDETVHAYLKATEGPRHPFLPGQETFEDVRDALEAVAPMLVNDSEAFDWGAVDVPEGYSVEEQIPGIWEYKFTGANGEKMASSTSWNNPLHAAIGAWKAAYHAAWHAGYNEGLTHKGPAEEAFDRGFTEGMAHAPREVAAHCLLRKNGDGDWVNDSKTWADGAPPAELVRDVEKHPHLWRIRCAYASNPAAQAAPYSEMPVEFGEWFGKNYPGNNIISDPHLHAPRIWRAAQYAMLAAKEKDDE